MASSGDLLADRRYGYAEAAFAEGDLEAAADLARQALDLAPDFAAAWFLLGRVSEQRSRAGGADGPDARGESIRAFGRALALDPDDRQGAAAHLAALGAGDPAMALAPGYVRALFDDYAVRFDRHLVRSLRYRGPELLHDGVRRAASLRRRPFRFGSALDLGCGTGLAAELFRAVCGTLAGVDLSPAMLAKARAKRLYDDLATGDLVAWLAARIAKSADLILAADVLVYLGDLAPVVREAARALAPDGLLAFTVQAHAGEGYVFGEDLRYAHAAGYLRLLASQTGLAVVLLEDVATREDRGEPVPGFLAVLGAPQARSVSAKSSPL